MVNNTHSEDFSILPSALYELFHSWYITSIRTPPPAKASPMRSDQVYTITVPLTPSPLIAPPQPKTLKKKKKKEGGKISIP